MGVAFSVSEPDPAEPPPVGASAVVTAVEEADAEPCVAAAVVDVAPPEPVCVPVEPVDPVAPLPPELPPAGEAPPEPAVAPSASLRARSSWSSFLMAVATPACAELA